MEHARARLRDEEKRRDRPAKMWGNGITIFNVHFTAGVVLGTLVFLAGLSGLVALVLARLSGFGGRLAMGRLIGLALVTTIIGAVTLYRSLVLGEED
jgi:hypothetical protein